MSSDIRETHIKTMGRHYNITIGMTEILKCRLSQVLVRIQSNWNSLALLAAGGHNMVQPICK